MFWLLERKLKPVRLSALGVYTYSVNESMKITSSHSLYLRAAGGPSYRGRHV